ncbi:MAG: hypothetical protein LBU27_09885 [Candidatus Peribacteria bacterium]|jgi:hypothetical protein|nr:hypothetical protein [Candidatus Peribacteria bacterium]
MTCPREQKPTPPKSAEEMLDEFINKAKEDSLIKQGEKLQEALEQLEKADTKEQMRDLLDNAKLEDFAKEMLDDLGNKGIIEQEKEELKNIEDEKELEKKLNESLLDPERKKKLEDYADIIRKNIEEQKKKLKTEMERFGFKEEELALYKRYKKLEKEVRPEVKKQIAELQKVLPPNYIFQRDEENRYHSGAKLDRTKLVKRKTEGETKLFQRSEIKEEVTEINMFETIIIDRSGSMGSFTDTSSPFFQSIKAAITRAKVLEHFKVQMSIVIFDDSIDEVIHFGETFSDRKTHIPSKLMRAATTRSGGNSQEPITFVYTNMKKKLKES